MEGTIVIGEGEMDEAYALYGEKLERLMGQNLILQLTL